MKIDDMDQSKPMLMILEDIDSDAEMTKDLKRRIAVAKRLSISSDFEPVVFGWLSRIPFWFLHPLQTIVSTGMSMSLEYISNTPFAASLSFAR